MGNCLGRASAIKATAVEMAPFVSMFGTLAAISKIGTMQYGRNSNSSFELRNWLVARRHEAGLTVRDVASIVGVPPSLVGKIETGARRLETTEFVAYCLALGFDPHEGIALLVKCTQRKSKLKQ